MILYQLIKKWNLITNSKRKILKILIHKHKLLILNVPFKVSINSHKELALKYLLVKNLSQLKTLLMMINKTNKYQLKNSLI